MSQKLIFHPSTLVPIGDTHVSKEDIPEATKFIKWLVEGIKKLNQNLPIQAIPFFMGDQYHLFGVKKVEVEKFWTWAFKYILDELGYPAIALIGNHDMNQEETANGMDVHNSHVWTIGNKGTIIAPGVGAIGFIRNEDQFEKVVISLYHQGIRKILCHADFDGAQFESGYYSPHGFKLDRYPKDLWFYSGHVHLKQSFGNIFYFGTPRHLTKSDIDEVKGIHIMDLPTGKMMFQETPKEVWSPFIKILLEEGSPYLQDRLKHVNELAKEMTQSKIYVEIKGMKDFVKKLERELPGGIKTSSTYTDEAKQIVIKESEGIPVTFSKFATGYFESANLPKDVQDDVMARIYQSCPSLKNGGV